MKVRAEGSPLTKDKVEEEKTPYEQQPISLPVPEVSVKKRDLWKKKSKEKEYSEGAQNTTEGNHFEGHYKPVQNEETKEELS